MESRAARYHAVQAERAGTTAGGHSGRQVCSDVMRTSAPRPAAPALGRICAGARQHLDEVSDLVASPQRHLRAQHLQDSLTRAAPGGYRRGKGYTQGTQCGREEGKGHRQLCFLELGHDQSAVRVPAPSARAAQGEL